MLINLLYLKKQLIKKDIEEYLKRISILIRRDEIRRIEKKTILEYKKLSENSLKIT